MLQEFHLPSNSGITIAMSSETHSLGKRLLLRVRILQVLVALPAIAYFLNAGYNYWTHPYDVWYFFT